MKDIFFFDSMLTPKIITFVYWLLLLGSVVSGVTTMFVGYDASFVLAVLAQESGANCLSYFSKFTATFRKLLVKSSAIPRLALL